MRLYKLFCREPLVARNLKSPRISGRVISALTLLAVLALNRTGFVDRLNASQATSGAPSGRDDSARMAKFERMARDGSEAALESRLQAYVRQHPSSARALLLAELAERASLMVFVLLQVPCLSPV